MASMPLLRHGVPGEVFPQAVERNALDSLDQPTKAGYMVFGALLDRPAKESVCCGSQMKLVLTMCDGKVERDTVTLNACVEQKAPKSVS